MPLQSGDIRFALPASTAQQDIGGGPPTSQLVPDGSSNPFLPDISEDARTGGLVEIVHLHGVIRNTDTDALLGANIIVAEPPDDPNVAITLIKSPGTFSRRPDLVRLIEASSTPGPEFNGYLLENHSAAVRGLQIAQRPGADLPGVNTWLVLVEDEGLPTETSQYVRVRRVTPSETTGSEIVGGNLVEFPVQLANCELFSPLVADFSGSSANRLYTRQTGAARLRKVTEMDAGTFYSAARLTAPVEATDMSLNVPSVYVQLVPNTRTETPLLNQMPGGMRLVDLTDSQGTLQVSAASHTARILVTSVNQGYVYTEKLVPPPAPNSITVSYVALNSWQTVIDDGAGNFGGGPGGGTVLYATGDMAVNTDQQPDLNTFIVITWADTGSFINNVPAGPVALAAQPPEFEIDFAEGSNVDGATVEWESGGVAKTATANAAGVLSGDATGLLVGSLGKGFVRPVAMPDAGSNFELTLASRPTVTESFTGVTVDGAGFAALALADEPIPNTVGVRWNTARNVTASSGADLTGTSSGNYSAGTTSGSAYTRKSESSSTHREVLSHAVSDDGAGGLGARGTVNYAGQAISLRAVVLGASTDSYRSDTENRAYFGSSAPSISVG